MKNFFEKKIIKNFQDIKFIYNLYIQFIKIYSLFTAILENFIFKKIPSEINFKKYGIFKVSADRNINEKIIPLLGSKLIQHTYTDIKVIEKKQISNFLNQVFNENLRNTITSITGFNYSIDFFIIY